MGGLTVNGIHELIFFSSFFSLISDILIKSLKINVISHKSRHAKDISLNAYKIILRTGTTFEVKSFKSEISSKRLNTFHAISNNSLVYHTLG